MVGDFVCALLKHKDDIGAAKVEVALRPQDEGMAILPWIEEDNFNSGFLMRGLVKMPRRGGKFEWGQNQDYWADMEALSAIDLTDAAFVYSDGKHDVHKALAAE